jgi:hypothetical protein
MLVTFRARFDQGFLVAPSQQDWRFYFSIFIFLSLEHRRVTNFLRVAAETKRVVEKYGDLAVRSARLTDVTLDSKAGSHAPSQPIRARSRDCARITGNPEVTAAQFQLNGDDDRAKLHDFNTSVHSRRNDLKSAAKGASMVSIKRRSASDPRCHKSASLVTAPGRASSECALG